MKWYDRVSLARTTKRRFKLIFYTPLSHVAICKTAIFAVGAGRYPGPGNYTECCWTTLGTGQFPSGIDRKSTDWESGLAGRKFKKPKLETICIGEEAIRNAVAALKKVLHPYEEPSYEVYKLEEY